jgi:uncharacterized membrane protein
MLLHWLIAYGISLAAFLVIDGAWIALVARKMYDLEAGDVIRDKPQLPAGILFYLIYVVGVIVFGVLPMTRHFNGVHAVLATYRDVAGWGAGLGLFAYATFSLTNQAVIKDWKYKLVVADMLWGAILTAVVTVVGFGAYRAFL